MPQQTEMYRGLLWCRERVSSAHTHTPVQTAHWRMCLRVFVFSIMYRIKNGLFSSLFLKQNR